MPDTLENGKEVRAQFAVNKTLMEEAKKTAQGIVDLKDLNSAHDAIFEKLQTAYVEMGDGLDMGKVKVYGEGKTAAEVSEFIIKNHSELAGYQDVLNEKKRVEAERREFLNTNPETIINQAHQDGLIIDGNYSPVGPAADPRMAQLLAQQGVGIMGDLQPKQTFDLFNQAQAKGFLQRQQQLKNLGDLDDADMKALRDRVEKAFDSRNNLDFDVPLGDHEIRNTTFQRSDGWAPQIIREPGWWSQGQRPVQLFDVIPKRPTNQSGVKYMLETTFDNKAVGVAENGEIPESVLDLTEQTVNIEKIGTVLPVTLEQLEDVDEVQMYLNERLPFMVAQKTDRDLYFGNGVSPNIRGIATVPNVLTEPLTIQANVPTMPIQDILDARTRVRVNAFTRTSHIGMHPNLWAATIKQNLASDAITFGNPQNNYEMRLFGIPIFEMDVFAYPTATGTADVAVLGDFSMFSVIRIKRMLNITMGYNADDFIKDKVTLKATIRLCLVLYRPKAFCRVTFTHS